uniref:Uncharacterized protein n=1 Tax=Pongo abelii TaxID=9601 RepID=H2NJ40_PONAB
METAVQKSCQVSSAGSGGSWSRGGDDPRGRRPPGTKGHGREGLDELGGRGPGKCGALGPVLGAFPGTVAESQGIGLWIALVVFLSFLIFSPSFYILNAEQPFFKGPPTEPAKELSL